MTLGVTRARKGPTGPFFEVLTPLPREAWGIQPVWYVDPRNSTGLASDDNVGDTALNPLLTMTELAFRLSRPTIIRVPPTVNMLSAGTANDGFFYDLALDTDYDYPAGVDIVGFATELATGTLTAATPQNPATNAYETITIAGFDWTPYVGKRVRVVSGTNVGACGWVAKAVSTGVAVVSRPALDGFVSNFTLGDVVSIETMLELGPVCGNAVIRTSFDFPIRLSECSLLNQDWLMVDAADFSNCEFPFMGWADLGRVRFSNCYYDAVFGGSSINAQFLVEQATFLGGIVANFRLTGGAMWIGENHSTDPGLLCIGQFQVDGPGLVRSFVSGAPLGVIDWTTTQEAAVLINPGGMMALTSTVFGLSAQASTFGIRVRGGGRYIYSAAGTKPTVTGALSATKSVEIGGTNALYAAVPLSNTTNLACIATQ